MPNHQQPVNSDISSRISALYKALNMDPSPTRHVWRRLCARQRRRYMSEAGYGIGSMFNACLTWDELPKLLREKLQEVMEWQQLKP